MSMNAFELEEARRRARQRVSRGTGRSDVFASLPPADRMLLARWARGVAALYAALAILSAIAIAAVHDRSNSPDAQTANLQRPQVN
jgi:hypothetical protein